MQERKFASAGDQTNKQQVMILTHSLLSQPGRAICVCETQMSPNSENYDLDPERKFLNRD